MGMLDQILGGLGGLGGIGGMGGGQPQAQSAPQGSAAPGGLGLNSPVVKALMLLLAAKAAQSYMARRNSPAGSQMQPQPAPMGQGGGVGGGLGGMLGSVVGGAGGGGGGLGGLLAGVAGGGGLGALLQQFQKNGYGDVMNSWIKHGPNQPIAPNQLADALGDDTVQHLQAESGMPRDQMLSELSTALPQAVDQLTPAGTLPGPDEMQHW